MKENIHIPYDQEVMPYHIEIGRLVDKYCKDSKELIDIGCGVGHTLVQVQKLRPELDLTIADIDDNTLDISESRVKIKRRLKINDTKDILKKDQRYDVVIFSHVLEHVLYPLETIRDLLDLLNNDGILILAVPNPGRLPVLFSNFRRKNYVNKGHVHAWDRSHWINFLENIAKLDVIEYSQDYFPIPLFGKLKIFRPAEIGLAKLFPWLSFSNMAVIRKS